MYNASIQPSRGLQTHPKLLGLLDHGEAEVVVVEPMIPGQEEELTLLRATVQYYMCVGVITILMDGNDEVEMPLV